jgi:hypothetical protein
MGSLAKQLQGQSQQVKMYAKVGKVMKHDDEAQDKVLIAKALKAKGLKCGGKAKGKK